MGVMCIYRNKQTLDDPSLLTFTHSALVNTRNGSVILLLPGRKIVSSGEAEKSVDESRQAENILRQALVAFTKANERHLVALAKTNLL